MKLARLGPAAAATPARQHPRPALAVILIVLAVVALDAMLPLTLAAPETCTPVFIDDFSHGNVLNSGPGTPNSVGGTAWSNTVYPVADNHLEVPSTSSWNYLRENLPCVDVTAFTGVSFTFMSTVATTPTLAPNRLSLSGYSDLASCTGSTQPGILSTLNNLSNYRQDDATFFIPRSAWFGGRDVQFFKMMVLYFDARSPAVVGPIWMGCSPQAVNTTTTLSATTSSESLTTLTTSPTANSDLSSTEPATTTTSTTTDLLTTSDTTGSTDSSTADSTSNTVSETSSTVLSTADLITASSTDTTSTTADLSTTSSTLSTSFTSLASDTTSSATSESLPTSTTLSTSFSVPATTGSSISSTYSSTNSSATSATAAVSGSLASTTVSTLSTAPGTTATTGTAQTSSAAAPATTSTTVSAYSTTTIRASAKTTTSLGISTTSTRAPATAGLSLTATTVRTGTRPCQSKPTLIVLGPAHPAHPDHPMRPDHPMHPDYPAHPDHPAHSGHSVHHHEPAHPLTLPSVHPFWSTPARSSVPPSSAAATSAPRPSVPPAGPVTVTLSAPPVVPGFTLSMSTKTVTAFQSPVVVIVPVAVLPRVTAQPDHSRPARALVKYDVDTTAAAVSAPETAATASFDPAVPAAITVAVVGAAVAAAVVVQRRRRNGSANQGAGEAGYGMVAVAGTRIDAETMVATN